IPALQRHTHRTLARDIHCNLATRTTPTTPRAYCATHPALARSGISSWYKVASLPTNLSRPAIQLPVIDFVAQILFPKGDRIHRKPVRQFIHQRLDREGCLGVAGGPHGD